jgi:hypothetical protein
MQAAIAATAICGTGDIGGSDSEGQGGDFGDEDPAVHGASP